MFPAMDRATSTLRRRFWIVLGLGFVLGVLSPGCAELKSQIFGNQKIGELGHSEDSSEVYARTTPRSLMPAPGATTPEAVRSTESVLNEVDEAGPAMLPAGAAPVTIPTVEGVALQAPRPIENASSVKLASANSGVPNAAKILAASERKPEIKPETIVAQARAAIESMTTYEVSMHRQERVNGTLLDEEDVVVAIRRSPRAVRLSWPSGPNKGREALYRADEPGGQMHIKMANPAMPRLSLNPESPMVMRNSRHPVTEAGFDSLIEGLENSVQASAIIYTGIETPIGLDRPAHCLTRKTSSGESWRVYLDVENHLPALVQEVDARGDLLERYIFHDIQANPAELASPDAFDPVARWGQPKSLLSRFTRGSSDNDAPTADSPR
jgi:hypothetical protein